MIFQSVLQSFSILRIASGLQKEIKPLNDQDLNGHALDE